MEHDKKPNDHKKSDTRGVSLEVHALFGPDLYNIRLDF